MCGAVWRRDSNVKYYFQLAHIKSAMLCAILLLSGCSRHNSNLTVVPLPNPAAQAASRR